MTSSDVGTRLDRWNDPRITSNAHWQDVQGRSPIALYLEYLVARRRWEERAWRAGGSTDPRFTDMHHDLAALHSEFSTDAPLETRDMTVVKPPSRDPSKVRVADVELGNETTVIRTLEDEFEGLLPIEYKVVTVMVDGRWRLQQRVTDHGPGRRINRL